MNVEKKLRRGGLVGPLVLIGAGIIALLINLGYLDSSIWGALFRIWPVFLIAAGLDLLIGRRSAFGSLLVLALILVVFAGGIWLAWRPPSGAAVSGEEIIQPLQGAREAEILISRAAGALEIGPLSSAKNLVEGTLSYRRGETAIQDASVRGGTAVYSLRNTGNLVGPVWGAGGDQWLWSLGLNDNIPMTLEVNSAAGKADLDLEALRLDRLQVSLAVGQAIIVLPRDGSLDADIHGAIGQVVIVIPESQEARIEFNTALVDRDLPKRFQRHDGIYTTPGYDGAESRIDVEVGLIIGSVEVRSRE